MRLVDKRLILYISNSDETSIDGVLNRFTEELGKEPASIVSTGGFSDVLAPFCRHCWIKDEELLLKGLAIIYYKNLSCK